MKRALSLLLLVPMAACASTPPWAMGLAPAETVREVAWVLPEPVPLGPPPDSAYIYAPSNSRQVTCTTREAARAIERAPELVYEQYEDDPNVSEGLLTAMVADVMANETEDRFRSRECRLTLG